ncbi:hypothetical protein ZYGR_0P02500 [Zygosaccharomyces rouxii]|uniref:ZYRO0E06402p n=2 Tax=Zygosaccharomyces rouxii TaxID=4956 RepID=C5E4I5_ZYGRC|nr:uncharacterized protein ZYRO0E06402g [Zygosaccharomyces rouxii]KAH9198196.1 hypothetical protein LQ764DRAFT_155165 [Zygosaccharomyces rouxii]GAV49605.1 hypothetical protein ZYGR_0P02500 [Zygosaccharomyces rouxii]CAR30946.1 ZYRO0E06402p [Zygosaccharomyces rouxii]
MASKSFSSERSNSPLERAQSSLRSAHRVPISCMFLCNFEVKKGNVLVWARHSDGFEKKVNLEDIEFKSMPSGVHEVIDDVINFVIPKGEKEGEDGHYNGVAYFKQNGQELSKGVGQIDRSRVKMYALGVVVDFDSTQYARNQDWKADEFSSANEYVDDLEQLLCQWFNRGTLENFDIFDQFFETYNSGKTVDSLSPVLDRLAAAAYTGQELLSSDAPQAKPHMLEYLLYWLRKLGPLIFPLWRSCLLNERILILNPPSGSFEKCNALCYCLSVISLFPQTSKFNKSEGHYVTPLYTLGVCDIDRMSKEVSRANSENRKPNGYIACTSDEILLSKPELYDKVMKIPGEVEESYFVDIPKLYDNQEQLIRATPHDLHSVQVLYKELFGEELSVTERQNFLKMIEPLSWSQYIIDGFYWWVTAGYLKPSYHEETNSIPAGPIGESELALILGALEYFHGRTMALFQKLKEIFESKEVCGSDEVVQLPSAELVAMDLDSFSAQDHKFIEEIAHKWFHRTLEVTGDLYGAAC